MKNIRTGKRVGIYIRISTIRRRKQPSDPAFYHAGQERSLREFVTRRGWRRYKVYADRTSRKGEKRPGFDALMEDARNRKLDVIVMWRFDRFGVNAKQLMQTLMEFRSLGIDVISMQDNFDTTSSTGTAISSFLFAIAETERRVKREHVVAGIELVRSGRTKSGRPVGRPRVVVPLEKIRELKRRGWGWRRAGRELGISASTVRRSFLASREYQKPRK